MKQPLLMDFTDHDTGMDCIGCSGAYCYDYPRHCQCGGVRHAAFVTDDRQNEYMGKGNLYDIECDECAYHETKPLTGCPDDKRY